MKRSFFFALIMGSLVLSSCQENDSTEVYEKNSEVSSDEKEVKHPTFTEEQGLLLPDSLYQSLKLKIVAPLMKDWQAKSSLKFHIFRESTEKPPAYTDYVIGRTYASALVENSENVFMQAGQSVKVEFPKEPGKVITGKILRMDHELEKFTGKTEVLIEIPDREHVFHLGEFVTADLVGQKKTLVLVVPDKAVLQSAEGTFVYGVKDHYFKRLPVSIGGKENGFTVISSGLTTNQEVVASSVEMLWLTELKVKAPAEHD